ncbi:aldose epimerase family protein [Acidicapsa ligni]|uniref:aldose epimerase family protein n=1 Tax=Acidicapsa ligni TaxID=542300 RepID=UPI0021DFE551|nr:hypothetical protein [Acidicapsa ligni]
MAGAKENVVISSGDCSLTLLPALGGKISSLRAGAHELLQAPLKPLAPRTQTMAFSASDASGWDECLPSVGECIIETETGNASIPDHGDLWRLEWEVLDIAADSATMRATCFSLPLEVTRTLLLSTTGSGWLLRAMYTVANRGNGFVPWSWAAHPLFSAQAGDRIVLPASIQTLKVEGSAGNRLGQNGDTTQWPIAKLADGSQTDLSVARNIESGIGDKLFAQPDANDAWCSLERPAIGLRLTVRFDPVLTPYIGLWICYGGWPDEAGAKQMCVAMEPTTAPVDSLAKIGPWSRILAPGETFTWPMELHIDRITELTEISEFSAQ